MEAKACAGGCGGLEDPRWGGYCDGCAPDPGVPFNPPDWHRYLAAAREVATLKDRLASTQEDIDSLNECLRIASAKLAAIAAHAKAIKESYWQWYVDEKETHEAMANIDVSARAILDLCDEKSGAKKL